MQLVCCVCVHTDPDDYLFTEEVLLFTPTDTVFNVTIPLTDDNVYESSEDFVAQLVLTDAATGGVLVDPDRATIQITDDDGKFKHI